MVDLVERQAQQQQLLTSKDMAGFDDGSGGCSSTWDSCLLLAHGGGSLQHQLPIQPLSVAFALPPVDIAVFNRSKEQQQGAEPQQQAEISSRLLGQCECMGRLVVLELLVTVAALKLIEAQQTAALLFEEEEAAGLQVSAAAPAPMAAAAAAAAAAAPTDDEQAAGAQAIQGGSNSTPQLLLAARLSKMNPVLIEILGLLVLRRGIDEPKVVVG